MTVSYSSVLQDSRTSPKAGLIGLVFGSVAAGGMSLWQHSVELTVATFMIAGYTASLWLYLSAMARKYGSHYEHLKLMEINRPTLRVRRLFTDFAFWWSLTFGLAVIGGAAWYGGLRSIPTIGWIECCWSLVTLILNYEVTVLEPTTRCRHCGYQLIGQLDPSDAAQRVRCPECGKTWSKSDLCLIPPGYHVITTDHTSRAA